MGMGADWGCDEEKLGEGRPDDGDEGGLDNAGDNCVLFPFGGAGNCSGRG